MVEELSFTVLNDKYSFKLAIRENLTYQNRAVNILKEHSTEYSGKQLRL